MGVLSRVSLASLGAIVAAGCLNASAIAQCGGFNITTSSGATIVPGTVDSGNHGDDDTTPLTLPFPITIYGATYNAAQLCANGNIQFTGNNGEYNNSCLPSALGVAICAHWDDMRTDAPGKGIFTSISGAAPNRIFNIEWRTTYYSGSGNADFELRLFEDNTRFEIIYGGLAENGGNATVGVQHTSFAPTQYSCNTAGLMAPGTKLTFTCYNGPTGGGTATPPNVYACGTQGVVLFEVQTLPGTNPPSTGISVTANLSNVNGPTNQPLFDNGTNGDTLAGDGKFSYRYTVPQSSTPGATSVTYTIADAQGRSTQGVIGLMVNPCPSAGPDVWVSSFTDVDYYGAVGNISAYAIGTDACNRGDLPVAWYGGGTQHPVIAQNMYRLMNGRFEQIGQSWLKHGFASTNSGSCGTCQQPPDGGQQLGVSCSDAYGAGLNGGQGGLGPRSEVNPTTGAYVWPFYTGILNSAISVRLQVKTVDVTPALNTGALYFGECQYVTADDARWSNLGSPATNGLNNVSYRALSIASETAIPQMTGPMFQMQPAIRAWKAADPDVTLVSAEYIDSSLGGAGIVARFWIGARATDNGNGTWHYEYAVHNLNADRAGGLFAVPTAPGAIITNVGFHGTFTHSGEPYPNTATNPDNWVSTVSNGQVRWTCPEAYQPPNGNNANALRWGTLYNFRFDSNIPPRTANATLGLFKPGTPSSIPVVAIPTPTIACDSIDFNNDTSLFDPQDIDAFLSVYSEGPCVPANATCNDIDFNNDTSVFDPCDIDSFLTMYSEGPCTPCGV